MRCCRSKIAPHHGGSGGHLEKGPHGGCQYHGQRAPEGHPRYSPEHWCATGPGRQGAQQRKKYQSAARNAPHKYGQRRQNYDQERQRSTDRKGPGRGEGGLHRSGSQGILDTQFVTRMRTKCVMRHQLGRDLSGQSGFQSASDVDCGHLRMFVVGVCSQLTPLKVQVRTLGIRL